MPTNTRTPADCLLQNTRAAAIAISQDGLAGLVSIHRNNVIEKIRPPSAMARRVCRSTRAFDASSSIAAQPIVLPPIARPQLKIKNRLKGNRSATLNRPTSNNLASGKAPAVWFSSQDFDQSQSIGKAGRLAMVRPTPIK